MPQEAEAPPSPGDVSASSSQPIRASATMTAQEAANARAQEKRSLKAAQEGREKRRWTHRKPKPPPKPKTKEQFRARFDRDQAELAELRRQLEAERATVAKLNADQGQARAAYDAEWSAACEDLGFNPVDVELSRTQARERCRQ